MNNLSCEDLLTECVPVSTQVQLTNIKYPCTGFCYYSLRLLNEIITLIKNNSNEEYAELINILILQGAKRKQSLTIHFDGERIDEDTVKNDFSDIYNQIQFYEYGLPTDIESEIFINDWYGNLLILENNQALIINRSHETFLVIKIDDDKFWIIDSHREKHGYVNTLNLLSYITRFEQSKHVQIGIFTPTI